MNMKRELNKALIRINADMPCHILYFGKELCPVKAHDYTEIFLPKGKHRLTFVSIANSNDRLDIEKEILDVEYEDIIDVRLFPVRNSRLAKKHAEEERLAAIRREQIRKEEEQKEAIRRAEIERRKKEEAISPFKFVDLPKLNFYDSINSREYGFDNPRRYIIAEKNKLLTIINPVTLLPIYPFEFEQISECNGNGDYLWVQVKKKWGLFNVNEKKYIVLPSYDTISRTSNSRNCYTLIVTIGNRWNGTTYKLGAINDKGELFIECKYEELYEKDGGYYQATLNGMQGLLYKDGRIKLNFVYKRLSAYASKGKYPTEYQGKFGVFNYAGDIILDFIYDKIEYCEPFGCGYHVLVKNGKYGIHICGTGQIIPCQYNSRDEIPDFKLVSYY